LNFKDIIDIKNDSIENPVKIIPFRVAMMGRLAEIGKVVWEIEPKTSNTLYSLPEKKKN